jgi:phage/plasmid-like protein (TIGR03299 family)
VGGYCLISSSADGSRATEVRETAVRVVCNNTIQMAYGETAAQVVRITHSTMWESDKVQKKLGLSREHFASFIEMSDLLTKVKVSEAAAEDFVLRLLRPDQDAENDDEQDRRPRGMDTILALFHGGGKGSEKKGSADTAWGLVNSITEYVDHHTAAKTPDHALDRALWGSGSELKTAALTAAVEQFV